MRILLLSLLLLAGCSTARETSVRQPDPAPHRRPVILISIDGFRADYLDRGVTPHLSALAAGGVRAAMSPAFPSITFPNHYTLVTGLRPDRHGIVGNTMEDAAIPGVTFRLSDRKTTRDRRWWDQAEPIWVTAERHRIPTATMFWPGSEAAIHGVRPAHWRRFDGKVPAEKRVDRLLSWLGGRKPPEFLTLYFDEVDHHGHKDGPDSAAVDAAAQHVDAAIGRLTAGLAARHIDADLVVVADHGMAAISPDRVVRLDRIAPAGSYRWITGGPYAGVDVVAGHGAELTEALAAGHDHIHCWPKAALPARFHYGHNPRVPDIICLADIGWTIANGPPGDGKDPDKGGHGFDPAAPEMQAIFIASGPDFMPAVLPGFDNVDVYPLVMALLGIAPLPNDGTLAPFAGALRR